MLKKNFAFALAALVLSLIGTGLADYSIERSTFAPGVPGKTGGTITMSEGAMVQTAAQTVSNASNWIEQGYIHRPFYLDISYVVIDSTPSPDLGAPLTQSGWYEPTGVMDIEAHDMITDGTTRYYFYKWDGAVFIDEFSPTTTIQFYKSQNIVAQYKTQYRVEFALKTNNGAVYPGWNPLTYPNMKPLTTATDSVRVSYKSQGSDAHVFIDDDRSASGIWADKDQAYSYTSANFNYVETAPIRWYSNDITLSGNVVKENAGATVECSYFQQYKCYIDILYSPAGAGTVDGVVWNAFHTPGDPNGWTDVDDWSSVAPGFPRWVDAASELSFPEMTSAGWVTVNLRHWNPLDKPIDKSIVYSQVMEAKLAATMFMWRGYTLIGIPLYPTEDTTAYREHIERVAGAGAIPAGWPPAVGRFDGRGDQDVVVYDDLDSNCILCDAASIQDSVFGSYGDWYSVQKYYPETGGYRRYRGPGVSIAGSVEPFWPGRGFWFIQDHCEMLPIDVHGTLVDIENPYDIALGVYNGSSFSSYNMIANPFFDPLEEITIDVRWGDAQVYLASDTTVKKTVVEAATANWIEATAQIFRRGGFIAINVASSEGDPLAPVFDALYEAEGFWVKTAAGSAGDTVYIRMRTRSLVESGRVRPSPADNDVVSKWLVRLGAESGYQNDNANLMGYKEFSARAANPVYSTFEMPEFTYPTSHLRVFFRGEDGGELSASFKSDRSTVMSWPAVIDARAVKGQKVRVNWDVASIPEGMRLSLKDPKNDKFIDMLAQKDYSFISDGGVYNVEVIAIAPLAWVAKEPVQASVVPEQFYFNSPMPNPFNASTRIEFGLAESDRGPVRVEVFDLLGRKISTIHDGDLEPGIYRFVWEGRDDLGREMSSGTYFIRLNGAGREVVKQVSLIK